MTQRPDSGFLRLSHIVGDPRKGIRPLIPIGRSTWWAGVKAKRFPQPVKLSSRVTVWRVVDIRALIEVGVDSQEVGMGSDFSQGGGRGGARMPEGPRPSVQ
jgi:hypothetical protein